MSPKIVNGSFAAIFDADEFLAKTYAGIRIAVIIITIVIFSVFLINFCLFVCFFHFVFQIH